MKKLFLYFIFVAFGVTVADAQLVKGDMNGDGSLNVSDITALVSTILGNSPIEYIAGTDMFVSNHQFVDLGLPSGTLWATCNIGAENPEDYGDYFAWGETVPYGQEDESNATNYAYAGSYTKTYYNWKTYKWNDYGFATLTKYCNNSSYGNNGFTDELTELELADDAAYANWGSNWRMPSKEQFDELINFEYTTSEWITLNGVSGRKITSITNGNSIFIPAAGYRYDSRLEGTDSNCAYWLSALDTTNPFKALSLEFHSNTYGLTQSINRSMAFSVRPVRSSEGGVVTQLAKGDMNGDGSLNVSDITALVSTILGNSPIEYIMGDDIFISNHSFVDLGLPSGTLWATCNVGAESPEDYGDYFAWGETDGSKEGKTNFSWSTYKWCNGSNTTLTKYCNNSIYGNNGLTDDFRELGPADDAAYANWGSDWRMPSREQFNELINSDYTTTEWTTQNGVNGYKITSKSNGNSIFLPATGFHRNSSFVSAGSNGGFWLRTLYTYPHSAWYSYYSSDGIYSGTENRSDGLSVRPVRLLEKLVSDITLDYSFVKIKVNDIQILRATVSPSDADNKAIIWRSSDVTVAEVSQAGHVTAKGAGTCVITCTAADGSGVTATCEIKVEGEHTYVDLSLPSHTLWATCNIGAENPEDYGDYFAWGETVPCGQEDESNAMNYAYAGSYTRSFYEWSTYKWCNGSSTTLTKYCTKSAYGNNGFTDELKELKLEDDAAYVNWGSNWRMPSQEQCEELINSAYTTTELITQNNVNGYKITSISNGNSIFLPAAGLRNESSFYNRSSNGNYWTRTLYWSANGTDSNASILYFRYNLDKIILSFSARSYGFPVRPVRLSE